MKTNTLTPDLLHKMDADRRCQLSISRPDLFLKPAAETAATFRYFNHAEALERRKWLDDVQSGKL
jgi:hypothetical protein